MDKKLPSSVLSTSRRRFLQHSIAATSLGALAQPLSVHGRALSQTSALPTLPTAFDKLAPLGERVHPITPAEFSERIAHAQRVMADPKLQAADSTSTPPQKYDALFFAPG